MFRLFTVSFVEKPIVCDLPSFYFLCKKPKEYRERIHCGFMSRFHPVVKFASEFLLDKKIYGINVVFGHDVNAWRENWSFEGSYAANAKTGGVIFDLCHEIDLAIFFLNKIEIISSLGLSTPNFHDVVFNSSIQGVFAPGGIIQISLDYLRPSPKRQWNVFGPDFELELDLLKNEAFLNRELVFQDKEFERNDMFLEQASLFLSALIHKDVPEKAVTFDRCRESILQTILANQQKTLFNEVI